MELSSLRPGSIGCILAIRRPTRTTSGRTPLNQVVSPGPSNRHSTTPAIRFLAAALGLLIWGTVQQPDLFAAGCDPFGYARQAELFRQNDLIAGLDTRFDNVETRELINLARSIDPNGNHGSAWVIAPHCHHYNSATEHVILQYPPGTGLLLSLFPEKVALAYVFIIGMTLVAATFTAFVGVSRPPWLPSLLATVTLALIYWTLFHPPLNVVFSSPSIPITVALIPVIAALSFATFRGLERSARPSLALLFGFLCGILLSIRLANAILLIGIATHIAVSIRIWRFGSFRRVAFALSAALAGFAVTGPLLILSANRINAGSIFATTYSPMDASPPILERALILENIRYYLSSGFARPALIGAILALVLRAFTVRQFPTRWEHYGASIGSFVTIMLSLAFLVLTRYA